jgi:hypothetical protein
MPLVASVGLSAQSVHEPDPDELPIERDDGVGLKLGQGNVLGVKRVRPSKLAGDLPCDVLKDAVSQQPNP